jgi:hypothetical protein
MFCVNTSHPQFKVLLEQTGLHPDLLKAEVSIWMDQNNSDSFPTTEDLQLAQMTASERAMDPMAEWLAEFDTLEEPVFEQSTNELITDFYDLPSSWEHQTDRDQTTEIDDHTLFNLMNNESISITPENKRKLAVNAKALGKNEAYRDYFEQNGVVRPASIVLDKLEQRYSPSVEETYEGALETDAVIEDDFVKDFQRIVQTENSKKAIQKIQQLSAQLGIEAEIVLPEELESRFGITQPGVKGFYKNGKVYLVEGAFDESTVFHEFCHPIIKSIAKENPNLFLGLYQEVLNTPEGQQIFKALTGESADYAVNSPEFMEEVIVKALDEKNKVPRSVIQNILFHIKQFLRKMLGKKINISKLEATTSLAEMLDMINEGGEFILDKDFLDKNDIIMFSREYDAEVDAIINNSKEETQLIINDYYNMVSTQLGNLLKDESIYAFIKEELATDNFDGDLQILRKMLDAITTSDRTKMANLPLELLDQVTDLELIKNRLDAFVGSLVQGGKIMDKFDKKLADLEANKVTTNDDFDALFALETYIDDWKKFLFALRDGGKIIQSATATKSEIEISDIYSGVSNPIGLKVAGLAEKINGLSNRVNNLKVESTANVLYENLAKRYTNVRDQFLADMDVAKKAGNMSEYNKLHEEYYGLTLEELDELNFLKTQPATPQRNARLDFLTNKYYEGKELKKEAFVAALKNKLEDSTWMNGMFESYMQNQDKIVSSFADYVNNFLQEVNGNVNAIEADFMEGLKPLLKAAGFDNHFFGEARLGRTIQHTNVTFEKDDEGNIKEFEEYAFISNFTGHEFELAKLNQDVVNAKQKWQATNDDADYDLYIQAEFALEDYRNDYMTQANIPEYYEAEKLFRTPAGIEAKKRRDEIFEEMRLQKENFVKDPTDAKANAELKRLWYEYQQLQSSYDLNGDKKTNSFVDASGKTVVTNDLAIAEVFQNYSEQTKDFHDYVEIEGAFDLELEKLEDYLINVLKHTRGSEAFEQMRNDWIKNNTTVEIEESYFDTRKELIEEKQAILARMLAANKNIADTSPLYDKIYAILKKTKDDVGEYDGNVLTDNEQATITALHEEIIEAEETLYTMSGLSKEELRHYGELRDYYDYYNDFKTDQDKADYKDYEDRMRRGLLIFGITPGQLARVQEIDKELRSTVRSESTDTYLNKFLELVKLNDESMEILEKFVYDIDNGTSIEDGDPLTHEHMNKLLENIDVVTKIAEKNKDFKDWFDRNHYTTLIPFRDENGQVDGEQEIWRKSAAWQYSKPSDPNMYKKKPLYSKTTGSLIGFLEVDGVFRVPNIGFKTRVVKPEYQTEIVERDYVDASGNLILANVDNRGRFLPRENGKDNHLIDANYRKMFETNRKLFDLMLYVKNQYLDNQKGLDASQKRYLTYPAIRRSKLEGVTSPRAFLSRLWESISSIFGSRVDDFEEGLRMGGIDSQDQYNTLTRPISGNYKLNKDFVSLNIIKSMGIQLYSIETFKAYRKSNSLANMLKSTLEKFGVAPAAQNMQNKAKTLLRFTEKGDVQRSNRLKQIDALIAKNFKGQQLVNVNSKFVRFMNLGMQRTSALTSFMAFAGNIYSSTKNFVGGEMQLIIKAASDFKTFNLANLTAASRPAGIAMRKILSSSFSNKQKDVQLQLLYVMDAVPGLYERRVGDQGSRTVSQSFKKGEFLFVDRKTLTDSVALHQFYAILLNNKFKLNGKKIALHKAIELVNGRIQTKPGVPKEFSISYDAEGKIVLGSKIKDLMNVQQGMLLKTTGVANSFSTPELYRYTLGRFATNMMRFFVPMAQDRYQIGTKKGAAKRALTLKASKRVNLYTQRAEIGTLVGALEGAKLLIQSRSYKALPYASKVALLGTLTGYAIKILLDLLIRKGIVFNNDDDDPQSEFSYDPEDEHIFRKLNASTGLPSAPFVDKRYTPESGFRFDKSDYWKMQGLRLALGAQQELETFDILNAVKTTKNLITFKSPLQEGGMGKIVDLFDYGSQSLSGEPDAYDRAAGPYTWQQKGEDKFWNTAFKLVSLSGKLIAPAYAIEQEQKGLKKKGGN